MHPQRTPGDVCWPQTWLASCTMKRPVRELRHFLLKDQPRGWLRFWAFVNGGALLRLILFFSSFDYYKHLISWWTYESTLHSMTPETQLLIPNRLFPSQCLSFPVCKMKSILSRISILLAKKKKSKNIWETFKLIITKQYKATVFLDIFLHL